MQTQEHRCRIMMMLNFFGYLLATAIEVRYTQKEKRGKMRDVRITWFGRLRVHKAFLCTRYAENVLTGHLNKCI
jgi:hypothetical protein